MKPTPAHRDLARLIRQRLTAMRLMTRLTLRDAAQEAGLSRGGLEKIESGANLPSIESLAALCSAYGETLGSFFASIEQQLNVAKKLRAEWPEELMLADEHAHRLDTLAHLAGKGESWELAKDMARLSETDPSVSSALVNLARALAPEPRRQSGARARAGAVAFDKEATPKPQRSEHIDTNSERTELGPE